MKVWKSNFFRFAIICLMIVVAFLALKSREELHLTKSLASLDRQSMPTFSLDSHLHHEYLQFQESSPWFRPNRDFYLQLPYANHKFLISQSYQISQWVPIDANTGEQIQSYLFQNDLDLRAKMDEAVSRLASSNPDHFSGLCGTLVSWSDLSQQIRSCLERNGMYGIKLRFESGFLGGQVRSNEDEYPDNNNLLSELSLVRLKSALEPFRERSLIVLIHLNAIDADYSPRYAREDIEAEVDRIFDLAISFPRFGFIIAHAGNSLDTLNYVVSQDRANANPSNLFIEFSSHGARWWPRRVWPEEPPDYSTLDRMKIEIDAWKQFGIDRILFGSDFGGMPTIYEDTFEREIGYLKNSGFLNEKELQSVFVDNGVRFLEIYRSDVVLSR